MCPLELRLPSITVKKLRFYGAMLLQHNLLSSQVSGGQRGKTGPCGYLSRARSGWGLLPLLRSHRDEEAESRGEMDEQDEEVELRLG